MTDPEETPVDPYARSEYRRLIAWQTRLPREAPFLEGLLDRAPDRSMLDVGCGTGEHVAFFARLGARAVGLDRSETMIAHAREHEARGEGRFFLSDARDPGQVLAGEEPFGLALCLGNMLPHLLERSDLEAVFAQLHGLLRPGGLLALQILNYSRLLEQEARHLPLNVRPGEGAQELVFLRLLKTATPERMWFFPTTLVLDPEAEEPVTVQASRRVELRPWTADDLLPALTRLGFTVRLQGDMQRGDFVASESTDLVVVATRGD